jgi:starch phosphorylase
MDPAFLNETIAALDPNAFLIGFSRRFATYKRAALLFSDINRAARLLHNPERPVQIIFSGKAHPNDRSGQELIAKVYQLTLHPKFRGRVFLLEDYSIEIGRMLVQGSDLWLNNPRRPLEASGTSGMKAAANGVPNASILDGWWDEAYDNRSNVRNGFAIGDRASARSLEAQDKRDGANLYKTLESQVIPLFFRKGADGLPHEWIQVMKNSIASSLYDFSTARMIDDYLQKMYLPAV